MITNLKEIIVALEGLPQTVEVRGAINAALRLRGALGQVTFPDEKVEEIEVVDEEIVKDDAPSLTASQTGIVNGKGTTTKSE